MNTKLIGNIAVVRGMSYFASKGYVILLPMADFSKYDFVVEKNGIFERIDGKYSNNGAVSLRSRGHYGGTYRSKKFNNKQTDYIWITRNNKNIITDYLIPSRNLKIKTQISLIVKKGKSETYDKYLVKI